jgi:putative pyruvate formate lyase activating enzyme
MVPHCLPPDIEERLERLENLLASCTICPRRCQVNRLRGELGHCALPAEPVISSFGPHHGEERVLSGSRGSGTIFFTSCNLNCVYCQNYEISQLRYGEPITVEDLAFIMLSLEKQGCHNINLVSPTPHAASIARAIVLARLRGLSVPIVYNTGGYDAVETLRLLSGLIDIYMPDFKYGSALEGRRYSNVPRYPSITRAALREMHAQVGDLVIENGLAVKGLLVRHLVLPNDISRSKRLFAFLASEISPNTYVNLMSQYYPAYRATAFPELSRRVTPAEYDAAVAAARDAGLRRLEIQGL